MSKGYDEIDVDVIEVVDELKNIVGMQAKELALKNAQLRAFQRKCIELENQLHPAVECPDEKGA